MTRAEQKVNSINKEIEKLTKSLERYAGLLSKKVAKCEKLDCNWTREEMFVKRENNEMSDEQWSAWFDKGLAEGNVEDTQHRLDNAFKRLERANAELEKVAEQIELDQMISDKELQWMQARELKEDAYYEWLRQFKADCLKDGIIIDEASSNWIAGNTKSGKRFTMYINNGWTERSWHSYTLRIDGTTYFTSGLFETGYRYLMNK
jgi:hypothetical protein